MNRREFRGIQLRQSALTIWGDRPADVKELLAQRKLKFVALSSGNVSLDPATQAANLAQHVRNARFVRDVGGRYPRFVHLELDTAHYQHAGGNPAEAVRRYAGRLLFLHLKDLDASNRFVELGRGQVDFKAVFAALDATEFDGWGVVELDSVPDAARTPKDAGAIARAFLEEQGRWNDAS